jgi:hypothetical protein
MINHGIHPHKVERQTFLVPPRLVIESITLHIFANQRRILAIVNCFGVDSSAVYEKFVDFKARPRRVIKDGCACELSNCDAYIFANVVVFVVVAEFVKGRAGYRVPGNRDHARTVSLCPSHAFCHADDVDKWCVIRRSAATTAAACLRAP